MPPKTNQFKQGQQPPPKKGPSTTAPSSSAAAAAAATSAASSSSAVAVVGYKPMYMLVRTAHKVMLQTVIPSQSASAAAPAPTTTNAAASSASGTGPNATPAAATAAPSPSPSSSSMTLVPPINLFPASTTMDCTECEAVLTHDGAIAIVATTNEVRVVKLSGLIAAIEERISKAAATTTTTDNNNKNINISVEGLPIAPYINLAEDKVCHVALSPLETFLVLYRMRDPKRPTEGNMSVYNLEQVMGSFDKVLAAQQSAAGGNNAKSTNKNNTAAAASSSSTNNNNGSAVVSPALKCVQSAWPALVWTPNEEFCIRYARGLLLLHEGDLGEGDENDDDDDANTNNNGEASASASSSAGASGAKKAPRCKIELQLPQNKEPLFETVPITVPADTAVPNTDKIPLLVQLAKPLPPLLAVFKPFNKGQLASLGFYRLPMFREPTFQIYLQKAEGAHLVWNACPRSAGAFVCVIAKQEPERGDNSYYAKTTLTLVNIRDKKDVVVKFPGVATIGAGAAYEPVHDVKWCPTRDEFIVVHGQMPRNKATLYNEKAQPLFQFGEAPRNLSFWSPNGAMFVLGGTGSLVGDFQFYSRDGLDSAAKTATTNSSSKTITGRPASASASATTTTAETGGKLGCFSEKSSEQAWSPDSRHLLCSTIFGKLRIDNKFFIMKHNGERCCEAKFAKEDGSLYQATWVPARAAGYHGAPRAPSPTVAAAAAPPKPALFKARGSGNAAAAAALSRSSVSGATVVASRPAGLLPGENPVPQRIPKAMKR